MQPRGSIQHKARSLEMRETQRLRLLKDLAKTLTFESADERAR